MPHLFSSFLLSPRRKDPNSSLSGKGRPGAACLRRRACGWLLTLCVIAFAGIPAKCQAQDNTDFKPDFHWFSLSAGGGWAPAAGSDHTSLDAGGNFQAGAGLAFSRPAPRQRWAFYLNVDFMLDQLGIKQSALQEAQILNPTNIGLLEATKGTARFYSTTLDPTFRFPAGKTGHSNVYVFGGFGWFRRSLDFTGVSAEGSLLQSSGPAVFGNGGNSGVCDAGAGVNVGLPQRFKGWMFYVEGRVIHGLAVNKSTTLAPVSIGVRW